MKSTTALSARETVITVPGLQQALNIMHVTDCHLTEVDQRDNETVRAHGHTRTDLFKKENYCTRGEDFERFIHRSNQANIHASVWTGDIIDFPSNANLDTITQQFALLHSPFLYMLGNHDWLHGHDEISD